jgi:hypothetical protein
MWTSETRNGPRARRGVLGVGVAVACLMGAGPASAHLRSGAVAVDYRATVASASTPAYTAQIYQSDHGLSLTVRPGHAVVLLGYLGEPVVRLDGAGEWINAASPTAATMRLIARREGVYTTTARWRLRRSRHTIMWHDARVRGLPAGVDRGAWTVPLVVDGRREALRGDLRRYPDPSPWPWLAVLAAWLGLGLTPLLWGGRDRIRAAAMRLGLIAAGASALTVAALAFDAYASPGTWIEALDLIAFLVVGLAVMWRGPPGLHVAAAIWVGLVSVAVGLLDGAVFFHPVVLAVLPGMVMRLLVTTALGAGLSAAVLGSTMFGEIAEAVRDQERVLARAHRGGYSRSRPRP